MFARHPVLSTALVAAFAALSSTAVFAESPTPEPTGFQSTRTRAEVKADVLVAAATHRLLPAGEHDLVAAPAARFAVSRAQVKAETLSARAAGTRRRQRHQPGRPLKAEERPRRVGTARPRRTVLTSHAEQRTRSARGCPA